ncbi:hypothetical protein [Streptomyces poonensis]|uniref:Uncharacterized protein n=1 Tax=Streptomyces poonensis TaxID=68255 RepID=A0A918UW36_9ACTN|nr:hypothetical protein [Streptomyces poonensis]GGZ38153.1 hypothetical protein GCM10010365_68690 [Streptomyces poonensis]GLJ91071.1 hypothetical protein GCM10017589_36770 [Streptomyces poonensis]
MPRGVTIGATHYPAKEAVRDVCRGIGGDVTDLDGDAFLRHLLEPHPDYELKRGAGCARHRQVRASRLARHPQKCPT